MGGKKKKSLANKLSKMSDEERARYLQHRAEVEEEAKKRKEQLIATFMKKKIKKEEAFSRLNMAKINQNWHQILRKIKVKQMKDEVEHLKRWIERVLEYKNQNQNDYIDNLQSQYQQELNELLDQAKREENSIAEKSNSEIDYLKTVSYGQEKQALKELRSSWELYSKQLYEIEYNALDCGISGLNNEQFKKVVTECVKDNKTLNRIWELTFSMSNEDDGPASSSEEEEVPVTKGIVNNMSDNKKMKSMMRMGHRFKRSRSSKMYNNDASIQRKYAISTSTTEKPIIATMSGKSEENDNNVANSDDICILQCIFEKLDMTDSNGLPDHKKFAAALVETASGREVRDFLQESTDECFQQMEQEESKNSCEHSSKLVMCLADMGKSNCEDWPAGNLPF
ncbi:unnamed protein product [Ceutorhynchus assimilis]|uniref:Dynein regulatory complex protein 1/2 N-terminal domain-containing protein n=1 Tax=Ceutorhynchus assimilis TaxID=467358 RepID=A0A9N9QPZ2_9CUCU|nr:unnamed protein product [Ceutorhynchus assimilis]